MWTKDTEEYWLGEEMTEEIREEEKPIPINPDRKKRRVKRRRKKKRYLLKIFLFILFCTCVYYLSQSDLFEVEQIEISGNKHVTEIQVKEIAGVKKGMNLFNYKTRNAERRLEEEPYIAEAKITKKWMNTVDIQLKERVEIAALPYKEKYVLVDQSAGILQILEKEPKNVPLLKGLNISARPKVKEKIKVKEKRALVNAMEVVKAARKEKVKFQTVDATSIILRIQISNELFCKGKAKNLLLGIRRNNLQAILADLEKDGIKKGMINIGENEYYSFNKRIR